MQVVAIIVLTVAVMVLMAKVTRLEREMDALKFRRKIGGRG